jgi:transcriptional regulator with XRE-family HTH domain
MNDPFADKLIRLRTQKGLTQRELAAMVGVSWSQISKYESGKSKPRKKALWALEEALGCAGELSVFLESDEVSVPVPAELYKRLEEAASEAGMDMTEYGPFFLTRLISWSHDELLGLRQPSIYTPEEIVKAQARMKPGVKESRIKHRLKELQQGTDDETIILEGIRKRQDADGRASKK